MIMSSFKWSIELIRSWMRNIMTNWANLLITFTSIDQVFFCPHDTGEHEVTKQNLTQQAGNRISKSG